MYEADAQRYAAELAHSVARGKKVRATWFNHFSVQQTLNQAIDITRFSHIGVDGIFLRRLLRSHAPRTSADLVVPRLIPLLGPNARIGLIGASPASVAAAAVALEPHLTGGQRIVLARSGYDRLLSAPEIDQHYRDLDLLLLGLGAPLQDRYLAELIDASADIILTCGGFIDQVSQPTYYPAWAYPLRLNWLVRLAREPRRLLRRYTIDALNAWWRRHTIRRYLDSNQHEHATGAKVGSIPG
jgi:UDP-N-acetyl-D-mannosaminuronic acid transferase (WecB/TagA/CpsF family)